MLKTNTMTFKEWLIDLFKDERGATSVKPVIAFLGALFLCVTLCANSFSHKDIAPADNLVNAVMIMTIAAIGGDTWDKFSKKKIEE